MKQYSEEVINWVMISFNRPGRDQVIAESKTNLGKKRPTPNSFLGCPVREVYEHWSDYLRSDYGEPLSGHFTSFAFLVIDEKKL